ncbi:MAG: TIGR00282 family metallophosphoesterase [Gemmatimonadetes bacterium]|nr:TIGR00282 family metallophosphoesterase [Gemmatimonadota bacterium]
MKILFVADIFARPGRRAAAEQIPLLIRDRQVDLVIANAENAAGGFGLTQNIVGKLHSYGADVITSGNHIWDRREFVGYLQQTDRVLRPLNYPAEVAGIGSTIASSRSGVQVGVINLQGRTSMTSIDCPFRAGRAEIERLKQQTPILFVDFHAEATAEKMALAWYLDGLATAVIGTHTHVQTADERILPQGTAYLTDAGMTGPHDSVIGVRQDIAIERFLTQVPIRFKPAEENVKFCGVLIDVDPASGRSLAIERLQIDLQFSGGGSNDSDD